MDRHRFDVDLDLISHVNADPGTDPDQDWHQNDADPMRILPQVSHMLENPN